MTTSKQASRSRPRIVKRSRGEDLGALAAFIALTAIAPIAGVRASPANPEVDRWYRTLEKPPFTPPDAVFGPVWTTLYALIATSGWMVWRAPSSRARSRALALWGTQLALNTAWSPLFFGARQKELALADITLLVATVAGYTTQAGRVNRPAAWMMAPYLAWLGLATGLNAEIVRRN
jgi:benzodiazapine receptor